MNQSSGALVDDYQKIIDAMSVIDKAKSKDSEASFYQEVMQKEDKVLDTLNRIADSKRIVDNKQTFFYNQSLVDIIAKFANTWLNIYTEIVVERQITHPKDIVNIFFEGDRKIYVGIMIVLISLFLFFIEISQ